jgi:hypothetical protein
MTFTAIGGWSSGVQWDLSKTAGEVIVQTERTILILFRTTGTKILHVTDGWATVPCLDVRVVEP